MFLAERYIISASLCLLVAGCSSNTPAPVVDLSYSNSKIKIENPNKKLYRNNKSRRETKKAHLVKPGETLYSIAWRYSVDHQTLAKINKVKRNKIYPGQKLLLIPESEGQFDSQSLVAAINKDVLNKKENNKEPKVRENSVNWAKPIPKSKSKESVKRWIWPVNGKIISRFSNRANSNNGLDIAAQRGTPVRATAEGKVVYSGNGLRGYGHLVIIKHNEAYLSAYAHNDKIHVQENEFVKAGQKIADLGSSGADREKLHFEIRYKGKPVDPLKYLPKSGI